MFSYIGFESKEKKQKGKISYMNIFLYQKY